MLTLSDSDKRAWLHLSPRVRIWTAQQASHLTLPSAPVPRPTSVGALFAASRPLGWVEDKRDRALHPRCFHWRSIAHPNAVGDCEDFALYWICALSKIRQRCLFAHFAYEQADGTLGGHAGVVFQDRGGGSWCWVSSTKPRDPVVVDNALMFLRTGAPDKPGARILAYQIHDTVRLPDDSVALTRVAARWVRD